jgi:MoaA/NifB/PqqE/SkfB family radical SAM enzyme
VRLRRYGSLATTLLAGTVRRPAAPWKLTLATTWRCNHRCGHCRIWERRPDGELTTDELARLFERNPSIRWLDLTGGEPTTRRDLPEIVRAATRHLPDLVLLHFPTNGALPDRAVAAAEAALERRPPQLILTVSLDGPRAVHDALRGVDGAWDGAIETFARLRELPGVDVVLGMTLTVENLGAARACYEDARRALGRLEPGELHFNVAQRSPHYYGNPELALPEPAAVERALAEFGAARWLHPTALLERSYRALVPRFLETGRSPVVCGSLAASAFVDPTGVVYPCITEDRPLASLRELDFSLAEVWRRTAAARDDVVAGRCAGCWTPCEAFPSLMASPAAASRAAGASLLREARAR